MREQAAKVLGLSVLYDIPGRFGGWPTIARSPQDELLVVFSGGRKHHVDPYGKTMLVRSGDQGVSWSEAEVINNSPLDDRDAGIVICADGSWLVSLFTSNLFATWKDAASHYGQAEVDSWRPYIEQLTPDVLKRYLGNFTILSRDQGKTWSDLRPVPVTAPHGPVVGKDGELLFLGNRYGERVDIVCYASRDQGETWQERGVLSNARAIEGIYLCEPHLVQLTDGRLLGQLRVNSADVEKRQLMQSLSADGGRSWSPVVSSGIWGLPPHLLRHSSGVLLSSYGHRREPFGQRVAISDDASLSWSQVLLLHTIRYKDRKHADDIGEPCYYQVPDLGYPATVELADGSLYSVWYQSRPDGTDAMILGCHWQLPF